MNSIEDHRATSTAQGAQALPIFRSLNKPGECVATFQGFMILVSCR